MQQLALRAIKDLLKETKHTLTVEDFDLVTPLDKIAEKVAGICDGQERTIIFPVEVGGINLYPLTIAKNEFIASQELNEIEFIYVISLPNDKPSITSIKDIRKQAKKLAKSLTCTAAELSAALDKVLTLSGNTDKSEEKCDYPKLVDILCTEYGSTPEYWLYHESADLINKLCERLVLRKHAAQPQENRGAPPATLVTTSLFEFREQIKLIRKAWSDDE